MKNEISVSCITFRKSFVVEILVKLSVKWPLMTHSTDNDLYLQFESVGSVVALLVLVTDL